MDTCPNETAKVTPEGVLFNGEYYSSLWAIKEKWFETVSVSGEYSLPAFLKGSSKTILMVQPSGHEDYIEFRLLTRTSVVDREQYYKKMQELKEQFKRIKRANRD
ncbi:hypothetical protein [Paenibacillus xylanexedens]|uniref:hypothetical protein n=1 Tax=Paenibacillus xylanexedens TaxID=528191 RepID=UPI0011A6EFE8|nr:hypothetical protein [Paenibacillus xylanexedens]